MKFILWSENLKAQSFMRFPVLMHLTMLLQLPQFYFFSVFCIFPAHLTAASDSLKKKKKKLMIEKYLQTCFWNKSGLVTACGLRVALVGSATYDLLSYFACKSTHDFS